MKIRLLRNATIVVNIGSKKFLVDPMLGKRGSYDPVRFTSNGIRNPTVELTLNEVELEQLLAEVDAVIVTHTHNDHWDPAAAQLIPKDKLIIGQPEDEHKFKEQGFTNIKSVVGDYSYDNVRITRTAGQHGTGEIGKLMAPVSGFILNGGKESIYIAGDTIWCTEVEEVLNKFKPAYIILNAGGAQFDMGDPIIMTASDVLKVCEISDAKKIICVHMEAINHYYTTRANLKQAIKEVKEENRCIVPEDGEEIILQN